MGIVCYFANLIIFSNIYEQSAIINICFLILTLLMCMIIYIVMIFMLKVLTIDELKGYIKK